MATLWEQMSPARQPDAGNRPLTDLQMSLGRLAWHVHFGVCLNNSEGFHAICLSIAPAGYTVYRPDPADRFREFPRHISQ